MQSLWKLVLRDLISLERIARSGKKKESFGKRKGIIEMFNALEEVLLVLYVDPLAVQLIETIT